LRRKGTAGLRLQLPVFEKAEISRAVENDVVQQLYDDGRTCGLELCGDGEIARRRFEVAARMSVSVSVVGPAKSLTLENGISTSDSE
jgi:hypothetical protein